ncbi:hypothetical protein LshimejAT787_0602870 [Lyophyllum shimeji]|uniref:YDG domain-containing protein n=1 Tax=Lyophyllum shimeji TaxID=47721 RepID=A0A9P3PNI1_LYOSH|nr:hypothetical protein LshimejAT787_0602870 [Lyophyllum shimeji]
MPAAKRECDFGEVEGVPAGNSFKNFGELYQAGVHGMRRAGIHIEKGGPYSIVLSDGGYDDEDQGETIPRRQFLLPS